MKKSRRKSPYKTKKIKRTRKQATELLTGFAERIERLERDNAVLNEALRALILKDTFSMHEIGAKCACGEYGNGEQADFDLGIWFYRRGAMLGDMECQWDYAMMLYSGEHMPQDKRKALYWFQKAAENPADVYGRRKDALEMCEVVKQELAEEESGRPS